MPKVFSRLPEPLHERANRTLWLATVACALAAAACYGIFSETTESSGVLWWKETSAIPFRERFPYLLGGSALTFIALLSFLGAIELSITRARQQSIEDRRGREAADARRRWEMSPEGQAHKYAEEQRALLAHQRQLWEASPAGRATTAFHRGDQFYSVELVVDGFLASHLNQIYNAGWREHDVSRRHERTGHSTPDGYGGHESRRESVEIRTYLFRRTT